MAQNTKQQAWSYLAGKKGKNRVRVYEDGKGGPLLLEWREPVFDKQGPVIDPRTGAQKSKRVRISLAAEGITSRTEAIKKAEQVAERFGELRTGTAMTAPKATGPLTLGRMLDLYFAEVVPTKKPGTQRQNDTDRRMFLAFFGRDAVVERIGPDGRPQTELGRIRYNEFVQARKDGTIPGFPAVKGQTIKNDVRFLRAVFRWAKLERDDASVLLVRNPWEGFPVPAGDKPLRQEMTPELHRVLVENAVNWRMAIVLQLCRETRRRLNSVRQLALADIDLTAGMVWWRGEFDKVGKTRVTPLTTRAIETIRRALAHRREEGVQDSPWLFPTPEDPTTAVPRTRLDHWMRRTKRQQGINLPRLGYHGEKRAGIRDPKFRSLDPAVQEELAGTTWETMRRIYDYVDVATMKDAVAALEADTPAAPAQTRRRGGLKKAA